MNMFFQSLSPLEKVFFICAVFGSILFLIRFGLQLIGIDGETDTDLDIDTDVDVSDFEDSDLSFKLLSIQGLTAFFMMFGYVGLTFSKSLKTNGIVSIISATIAGLISVWIISKIFNAAKKLHSSGTIKTDSFINQEGIVYLTIKENSIGKVNVTIGNRSREYSAKSLDGKEIPTDTPIKVIRSEGELLIVTPNNA